MGHNYQLNWATAGIGKPRVLELWDGANRICAITSPDKRYDGNTERLQIALQPLVIAANMAEDCDELKDRIAELEDERDEANEACGESNAKVDDLQSKIEEMEAAK